MPKEMNEADSPFFLAINYQRNPNNPNHCWFKKNPLGKNQIYKLVPNMKANCPALNDGRKLTNHSVRKHLLQKCNDMGLAPTATVQISGLQSVNSYSKLNDQQQKKIAMALINNDKCPEITIQKANSPPAAAAPSTYMGSPINQSQTISYKRQFAQRNLSTIFQGTTTITGGVFNSYTGESHSCPVHDASPSRRKYR